MTFIVLLLLVPFILLFLVVARWITTARRFQALDRKIEQLAALFHDSGSAEALCEIQERVRELERKLDKIARADTVTSASFLQSLEKALSQQTTSEQPELPSVTNTESATSTHLKPSPAVMTHSSTSSPSLFASPLADTGQLISELKKQASERIHEAEENLNRESQQATTPPSPSKPSILETLIHQTREKMAGEEWEALIGGNWLNKIGTVVLVIGVALFLGYSLQYMGPLGKCTTGLAVSLLLLIGGTVLERSQKYKLFARPLIGGGWALLYFTGYAAHNIDAAKIIDDPVMGFFLLTLIAVGMVLHSFKYKSEVVTGFAYLLAFLTVSISPPTRFSLIASAVLAGSLVAIARKLHWQSLGLFGLTATYLNHLFWLDYRMGGAAYISSAESFWLAQGMLILYWCVFTVFAFVLKPLGARQEQLGVVTNVANTGAFLALGLRQMGMFYPEGIYLITGFTAIGCALSSYLMYLMRLRVLYLVNGTIAVALMAITFPLMPESFPLSRDWLAIAWLAEAGVVLALGFYLGSVLFRSQAYLLMFLAVIALFGINLFGWPELPAVSRWLTVLSAVGFLYYALAKVHHRALVQAASPSERDGSGLASYLIPVLLAALLWRQVDADLVGLAILLSAIFLVERGIRSRERESWKFHLRNHGYVLSVIALGPFFIMNLPILAGYERLQQSGAWMIVAPAIAALYALFFRIHQVADQGVARAEERSVASFLSYAAAGLLIALLLSKVGLQVIGASWLVVGMLLLEAGIRFWGGHFRAQGYAIATLAFWAIALVNLYEVYGGQEASGVSRWFTVAPAVFAFYVLFLRLHQAHTEKVIYREERGFADASSLIATILLVALLWKQLDATAVALAWGFLGLLLYEAAIALKQEFLRYQAHFVLGLTFGRLFLANFTAPGEIGGLSHRLITFVPVVAIFYYLRARVAEEWNAGKCFKLEFYACQTYSYAAAVLLVTLARFEFGRSMAVVAWGMMSLAFLTLGISLRDRDFRIQSYLLAVITFWRSWSSNFYLIGSFYGIPERIAITIPVLLAFYAAKGICLWKREFFSPVKGEKDLNLFARIETYARPFFSLLATGLLTVMIFYEAEGNLLTIAWTIEGFGLLALGFLIPERTLRLSGLALLMGCLLKLFLIDLQGVETIYRIVSFIILGTILVLVSFGYTRCRHVIRQYL